MPLIGFSQKTTIKIEKEEDTFLKGVWVDLVKSKCNCTIFHSTTNRIIIKDSLNNDITEFFDIKISLPHYVRDYTIPKDIYWNEFEFEKHIILVDKSPPRIVIESKLTEGILKPEVQTANYPSYKVQVNNRFGFELPIADINNLDSVFINSGDAAVNAIVTSFKLQIDNEFFESPNNKFTDSMKNRMKLLSVGDKIIIRKIQYTTSSINSNSSYEVGSAEFIFI